MKAQSIEWTRGRSPAFRGSAWQESVLSLYRLMDEVSRGFAALAPGAALLTAAAWAVTVPELAPLLQATIWVSGFLFLGIALDARSLPGALAALATGLVLPLIALLSAQVAAELAVLAALPVGAWLAAWIRRR